MSIDKIISAPFEVKSVFFCELEFYHQAASAPLILLITFAFVCKFCVTGETGFDLDYVLFSTLGDGSAVWMNLISLILNILDRPTIKLSQLAEKSDFYI